MEYGLEVIHIIAGLLILTGFLVPGLFLYAVIIAVLVFLLGRMYVGIYNDLQFWKVRGERLFANVDIIIQQRQDQILAQMQTLKSYNLHEYKTLSETIKMRKQIDPNASIKDKIQGAQETDNSLLKIQAVFEKYPTLKAESLHQSMMGRSSISEIENKMAAIRLRYDVVAEAYNRRLVTFPRKFVAKICKFKPLPYIALGNQVSQEAGSRNKEQYKAKELI